METSASFEARSAPSSYPTQRGAGVEKTGAERPRRSGDGVLRRNLLVVNG
jgi:hypothetical protein